jgi:predicted unusual protein kinase regulating ubiquinone biosynthesis (AarF/ABC1/UbiB family)
LGRLGVGVLRSARAADGPARDAARRLVAARMGELRGLPQKIGQMVSVGAFDRDDGVFAILGEGVEPVPAASAFAWIEQELGRPVHSAFRMLAARGAAASLGQTHRGELLDGTAVAVKIQFPGIRDSLDADLLALGWLTAPLSANRSGFSLAEYRAEMRRSLLCELDYGREADALQRFAARVGDVPGLVTPVPVEALCTPRLLTMSWVPGERIEAARTWPAAARQEAGLVLLRTFLQGCFVWRELHADPHAGNLRFDREGAGVRVGLLDFGCVKSLARIESASLQRLAVEGADLTDDELWEAYVGMGFSARLLEPMATRLRAVTSVLFEPFHTAAPYDLRRWQLSARLAAVLGDDRWNFRFAGPASLLFVIRAFQGLCQYLHALEAPIDWRHELLAIPQTAGPRPSGPALSLSPMTKGSAPMGATTLRIRVDRNGENVVQLSFNAVAVGHLEELVPDDLGERLRCRGIDLGQIAEQAVAAGYPAGDLFTLSEGEKQVRVWLE